MIKKYLFKNMFQRLTSCSYVAYGDIKLNGGLVG